MAEEERVWWYRLIGRFPHCAEVYNEKNQFVGVDSEGNAKRYVRDKNKELERWRQKASPMQ